MNITYDNNVKAIGFSGLTNNLSRFYFNSETITQLNKTFKNSNGIVGHLPPEWMNSIPLSLKRENILGLYNELGKLFKSLKMRFFIDTKAKKLNVNEDMELCAQKLNIILQQYGAIPEGQRVSLKYLSSGAFGAGYVIKNETTGKCLFLKKFFTTEDKYSQISQGIRQEVNSNLYVRKQLKSRSDKKHFPRFYYADINNGYYIEEFLPNNTIVEKTKLSEGQLEYCNNVLRNVLGKIGLIPTDTLLSNYKIYRTKDGQLVPKYFDLGGLNLI